MKNIKILYLLIFFLLPFFANSQNGQGNPSIYKEWQQKTLYVVQYPHCDGINKALVEVAKERWLNDKIETVSFKEKHKVLKKRTDVVILQVGDFNDMGAITLTTRQRSDVYRNEKLGWAYTRFNSRNTFEVGKEDRKAIYKAIRVLSVTGYLLDLKYSSKEYVKLITETVFNTMDKFKLEEYSCEYITKDSAVFSKDDLKLIKNKTLILDELTVMGNEKSAEILKGYNGGLKILDNKSIATYIDEKQDSMILMDITWEISIMYYTLIDLETRKILYANIINPPLVNNRPRREAVKGLVEKLNQFLEK